MSLSPAKASSSCSSVSNSTPKWNFHVFLSFRGPDTRKSFTDHLYAALWRKGIITYRDDEELERGEVISHKLLKAIEDSLFTIVVLSKNYASSSWCLDELQNILASRNEWGQQVLPIFYGVDPSDVRHQKGSFAEAFNKHEEKFREDQERVRKWRDCLTEIANLSGWDSKDWHEAELIEVVVQTVWEKLRSKLPSQNGILVGIDSRLDAIDSLLEIGMDDVRFIGMWGMGGIGKTTLASIVYEKFLKHFEICCFLGNVREAFERYDGHIHLQTELLSHLNKKGMVIENTYQGKNTIRNLFCNKKVLLVLDDVSLNSQLENLAESQEWFGAGSRIIITTRNVHLLKSHGVHKIYEVKILNKKESIQLFSNKAFRSDKPHDDYLELSKSVVEYAGGLPLALNVLGSTLFERSVPEWEDVLAKLKKVPNKDILKILRISYDALEDAEKTIFLDIACFFKGWRKDEVTHILKSCDLHPTIGISVLIERSLLTEFECQSSKYIAMHDLVQEMGKSIVFKESPNDVGRRSRLWSRKDIDQVLKRNNGTEATQGVVLPFSFQTDEAYWDSEGFSKMCNLRLLIISCNLKLPCGLKCLSSALKVLQWNECPLKALPLGAQLDELVYLKMLKSKIKQLWNGRQHLENLKFMDLSHSKYFIRTPDYFGVPNLQSLILEGCTDLVEIHPSLGQHKNLLVVNLKGCRNLKALPEKLEMISLKEFILCGCTLVRKLPEFGENMKNLVKLDLEETGITKLPTSVGFLISLEVLNLKGCKNLVCLPRTMYNLKHLKILDIFGCSNFSNLPENLNENEALEKLDGSGTAIAEVPSSIGQLGKLRTLSFRGCKGPTFNLRILPLLLNQMFQRLWFPNRGIVLPPSIFNLKSLTELDLSFCNIDEGFIPGDLSGLSSLQKLDLRGNNFMNLPAGCVSTLLKLQDLYLNFCPRLRTLPQPSPGLQLIDAGDCASIKPLSDEQLWYLFGSIDEGVRYTRRRAWSEPVSLSNNDLAVTIPGSEIPSWFENRSSISLDGSGHGSVRIDVPQDEWLGFALCTVLDDPFYSTKAKHEGFYSPRLYYNCEKSPIDKDSEYIAGWESKIGAEIDCPHLAILFLQISKKNGSKSSVDYNQLHFHFLANVARSETMDTTYSLKCGWRVIRKQDFQEWGKTRGQSLLMLEEHNDGENGICSGVEERGQCSLKLDDPWMQFNQDDAGIRNSGEKKRISGLNLKRKGEPVFCKSDDQATKLSSSFDAANKRLKTSDSHMKKTNCEVIFDG